MNLEALLGKLRGVRKSGSAWKAFCPAHDDKNPSFSIDVREQKILLFCHAGCSQEAVIAALGIEPSDLFLDANDIERRIVAIYDYPDEQGKLLYQNVRYHPKDFRLRRPDGNGGWIWSLNGVRRVPYKLPEIIAADFVLIPEGEKDANTSQEKLGFAATSSKHWRHEFCESIRGKRVVIIADADGPGRKTAREVANSLLGKVPSLKLIELPGAKDLTEWVAGGGTRDALEGYIESQPEWKPQREAQTRETNSWVVENMADFLANDGVEPEPLYERLLYPETITEVFSPRGLGKSVFALHIAIRLARNGKRVLYIDRDNPRRIMRERMRALGADSELARLKVISREKCPPLTRSDAWTQFPYGDYDLVIFDSFDSMAEGVGEQDSSKPSRAIAPILDIAHRENGPAVLVLGNCVKSAMHSRGSGIVEDRADVVFEVRDATDFHPTGSMPWVEELPAQGASDWASRSSRRKLREQFRLAFICTKFRLGEEPAPFILEIDTAADPWSVRDVTDAVDREGAGERERRAKAKDDAVSAAIEALRLEIVRRERAGEDEILKMKAEAYLAGRDFKRNVARKAIASSIFTTVEVGGKGHPKIVRLADKNPSDGGNKTVAETAKTLHESDADFRHPHKQGTAEINAQKHQCLCDSQAAGISANAFISLPFENVEIEPQGDVDEGEI